MFTVGPINYASGYSWPSTSVVPSGVNPTYFYFRAVGYLIPLVSGVYTLGVNSDDGCNLIVGGHVVVSNLGTTQPANSSNGVYTQSGQMNLSANVYYEIVLEWQQTIGNYGCQLVWTPPGGSRALIPAANLSTSSTSVTGGLAADFWNGTNLCWYPTGGQVFRGFVGAWTSSQGYMPGDEVTYNGAYWKCLAVNSNSAPTTTNPNWQNIGLTVTGIAVWSSATAYYPENQVTFDGNVYQCTVANTNVTPPNFAYWTLVGATTIAAQGKNALYNGGFQLNQGGYPTMTTEYAAGTVIVDGWTLTGQSGYSSAYLSTNVVQAGNQALGVTALNTSTSLPSNDLAEGARVCSQPIPITPGDTLNFTGYMSIVLGGGLTLPSGVSIIGRMGILYYNNTGTSAETTPFADQTAAMGWTKFSAAVTVPATVGGIVPSYAIVECCAFITNNSGSALVTNSTEFVCMYFDSISVIPRVNLGSDVNGNLPSTGIVQINNNGCSNSTGAILSQAGTTMTIEVAAFTVQYGFGTVSYNSGSVTPGGYGAWLVYFADPTYAGGSVTFLATANLATTFSNDGYVGIGIITTASGGGGTGGGGGGGGVLKCFTPDTLVKTLNGETAIGELEPGDLVLTAKGTWVPIFAIVSRDYEGPILPTGVGGVTPHHGFLQDLYWVSAYKIFGHPDYYEGKVLNLVIKSDETLTEMMSPRTEHSFTLANGLVAHNTPLIPS